MLRKKTILFISFKVFTTGIDIDIIFITMMSELTTNEH